MLKVWRARGKGGKEAREENSARGTPISGHVQSVESDDVQSVDIVRYQGQHYIQNYKQTLLLITIF